MELLIVIAAVGTSVLYILKTFCINFQGLKFGECRCKDCTSHSCTENNDALKLYPADFYQSQEQIQHCPLKCGR